MGKSNNKRLDELQDLNKLEKEKMQNFLGGENEPKKKHWLRSFCGGILRQ